jgi:hypothetical protein
MGPLGGAEFAEQDVLRAAITVRDARGNAYAPLPPEALPGDLKNLSALLGAMFGNMLGPMSEGHGRELNVVTDAAPAAATR